MPPPAADAEVLPFIDDMATRLGECDVIVCRAGAITVSELCAAGVAAVLVPLRRQHDLAPARQRASGWRRAAPRIHLPQARAVAGRLADLLRGLTRDALLAMATKARALARPHAAARVADEIEAMVAAHEARGQDIHLSARRPRSGRRSS